MANFEKLVPIVKMLEGKFAGNIDGQICTMEGITLATYRSYFGKSKTCNDLKNITDNQWNTIFINGFWNHWLADKINNQSVANLLVDWVWTSGINGIKYPQEILGVSVDGIVGPKTLAAINDYPNQEELFNKLWEHRKKYFESIAKGGKSKFLKGWLNRLNAFKFEP